MTNLFKKIVDTITNDITDLLDQKEQNTPSSLLNQYIHSCEKETEHVEILITRQIELKQQILKEKEEAQYLVTKRTKQADIAKEANKVDLELQALKEAEYYTMQVTKIIEIHANVEQEIYKLENQLQDMHNKLKEMKMKRLELMSRENIAHANRRMNSSVNTFSSDNPFFQFEEVEKQMTDLETKVNTQYSQSNFDIRIAKLEKELEQKKQSI